MKLNVENLIKEGRQVYVKNNTRPKGHIVIQMILPTGARHPVVIPRTHLPICLNDFVSGDIILQSHDLRQYLAKEVIVLVDPVEAEQILSTPDAVEEMRRLKSSEFSATSAFVSDRVNNMEKTIADATQSTNAAFAMSDTPSDQITPRVLDIVNRIDSKDLPIKGALSELKAMVDELSAADCAYIITNGPDGQIKQYVQSVLANLKSTGPVQAKPTAPAATFGGIPSDYDISSDDDSDLSAEERIAEEQRAAIARANQQV